MYWLDTVILCMLAGGALLGALMGFLWQMFWIIAVATGLFCTIAGNDVATAFVERYLLDGNSPAAARGLAYVIVFGAVFLVFLIATLMVHRLVSKARLQWLNRLLGSAFVAVLLASALGLLFVFLSAVPASRPVVEQSKIAPVLVAGIQSLVTQMPPQYRQTVEEKVGQSLLPQPALDSFIPAPKTAPRKDAPLRIPLADQVIQELSRKKS